MQASIGMFGWFCNWDIIHMQGYSEDENTWEPLICFGEESIGKYVSQSHI
jgi:hypothetical protein